MSHPAELTHASSSDASHTTLTSPKAPAWMKWTLRAAALYNLTWGFFMMAAPNAWWSWLDLAPPNYIFLWSGTGLFVALFGIGYWIASPDPARHWGLIALGFASKVLTFLGSLHGCFVEKNVPIAFAIGGVFNDLAWWMPFGMILWWVWRERKLPN